MRFLLLSVATNDVSLKSSSSRQSSTSRKSSGSHSGGGSVLLDGHADGQFDILVSSRELGTQGDSTEVTTHKEGTLASWEDFTWCDTQSYYTFTFFRAPRYFMISRKSWLSCKVPISGTWYRMIFGTTSLISGGTSSHQEHRHDPISKRHPP